MNTSLQLAPRQSLEIYRLLSARGNMTAREIGNELNILPNAVYRANKQLLALGVIEKSDSYPVVYSTVPMSSAMGWFLIEAQRSFRTTFSTKLKPNAQSVTTPKITFIKSRTDLLKRTDNDVMTANKAVDFVVSGLEVPDTTVLAFRKATTKGVAVRALIQKRRTSKDRLENWKALGVDIRETDDLELRLFIIDSKITYITSYSQNKKEEAFGIRFEYPPLAALMSDLFEIKWRAALSNYP